MGKSIIKITNLTGYPMRFTGKNRPIFGVVNPTREPKDIMQGLSSHIEVWEHPEQGDAGTEGTFNYRIEDARRKELGFVEVQYRCRGNINTVATLDPSNRGTLKAPPDFEVETLPDNNAQRHQLELKVYFTVKPKKP